MPEEIEKGHDPIGIGRRRLADRRSTSTSIP